MIERVAPADLYLDTDVVVNCVIRDLRYSDSCLLAISRAVRTGSTIWFSQLLLMEFAQAVRSIATQMELPDAVIDQFRLNRWSTPNVRQEWMRHCWSLLEEFLGTLPIVVELPITRDEISSSVTYMGRYALRSQDAVHLATALHYEIPVFWTCDDHFARVDDLHVEIISDSD